MSFNVGAAGPAFAVKSRIASGHAPKAIKAYISAGIDALVVRHGPTVRVSASAYGHAHSGKPGDADVTSVTANVAVMKTQGKGA